MERDPNEGGTDVGRDFARDLADEPVAAIRDAPPDILAPIDESAPVSGHVPAPEPSASPVDAPEHDWSLARGLVRPAFRPVGTTGLPLETVDRETLAQHSMQSHSQPLLDEGPAGIPVVYAMAAGGFDILVNGDHLLSWGIEPAELQSAAVANLREWAATAPWTDETEGDRRLIARIPAMAWMPPGSSFPRHSTTCSASSARMVASWSASRSDICWRPRHFDPTMPVLPRCSASS